MALFNKEVPHYPSQQDIHRIGGYNAYQNLYNGDHHKVMNNVQEGELETYIAVNLPRLIANVSADLLFGEAPRYVVEDPEVQEAIDRIARTNKLTTLCHESALSNAYKGDALFKVRYGKRTKYSTDREVIIQNTRPDIYYPEIDPEDVNNVISHNLAWLVKIDKHFYLKEEKHYPGKIVNNVYLSDEHMALKRKLMDEEVEMLFPGLEPVVDTGIDDFLIVHVPNMRIGDDYFGQSDFKGLEGLFDELNSRLSQISMILDKHANPKLAVPEGIVSKQGIVRQQDLEVIEMANGADKPAYITWDARLEAAYSELDRVINLILTVSEISPSLLGMDNGGQAESGRALKFRLMNTIRKINKKRTYYDEALKKLLVIVQKMEVAHAGYEYPIMNVDIQWSDGLPDDNTDERELAIEMFKEGIINQKKALQMIFPSLSEEAIDALIEEEEKTLDEE